jgi:hypothetical protein
MMILLGTHNVQIVLIQNKQTCTGSTSFFGFEEHPGIAPAFLCFSRAVKHWKWRTDYAHRYTWKTLRALSKSLPWQRNL